MVPAADLLVASRSPAVALMTRTLEEAEVHTGAMIALVPTTEDAKRLAVDDGEPAEELHVTLRYLGKGADFSTQSRERLIAVVRGIAEHLKPFTAEAFNVAIFNPSGEEPCVVLGLGGEDIVKAHAAVEAAIEEHDAELPEPHKPFVPHLTLVYTADAGRVEELTDRVGPIAFDRLRVAFAGEVTDIPLAGRALERTYVRDDEGQFADVPGVGNDAPLLDKLKGAGRIELEPGERLLRSDRIRGDNGRAWLAVVEKGGKRSLRIGLGNAEFGTRRDSNGPWRAAEDRSYEINEERQELIERREGLESEIEELEAAPDADPAGLAARRAQLEELYEADTDEVSPNGHTAILNEQGARQLRETLAKALDDGEKLRSAFDPNQGEIDRLEARRDKLRHMDRKWTDEEDAEWDRLTAEVERLEAEQEAAPGPDRPERGYWVLAEGSIPGQWANVHYEVFFDDPTVGVETKLGAIPHHYDQDFTDFEGEGTHAEFAMSEADEFVRLLAKMDLVGDGANVTTEAVLSVLSPSPAVRLMLFARSLEATEFIKRGGKMIKIERGAKGRFGDMIDGPELDAIIANPKPGDRERLKAHFGAMKTAELRAEAKKRGVYIGDVGRKEQMADRIVQHEIGHKLDSQAIQQGAWDDSSAWTRPAQMQLGTAAEPEPDLDKMTNPQLKELAKAKGVKGYSKMRKAELVQAIRDSRDPDAPTPTVGGAGAQPKVTGPAGDVAAQLEDLGRRPKSGDEERAAALLEPLSSAQLSEIADSKGWGRFIKGTKAQKRELLVDMFVGSRLQFDSQITGAQSDPGSDSGRRPWDNGPGRLDPGDLSGIVVPPRDNLTPIPRRKRGEPISTGDALAQLTPLEANPTSGDEAAAVDILNRLTMAQLDEVATSRGFGRDVKGTRDDKIDTLAHLLVGSKISLDVHKDSTVGSLDVKPEVAGRFSSRNAPKAPTDLPSARAELDRMRANPQRGDRAKVAEILKPMRHKDLDQLAADNGWVLPGKATLPQKRAQLEEHLVGRRLSSDAIFGLKDRPTVGASLVDQLKALPTTGADASASEARARSMLSSLSAEELRALAKQIGPTVALVGTRKSDMVDEIIRGTIRFRIASNIMLGGRAWPSA